MQDTLIKNSQQFHRDSLVRDRRNVHRDASPLTETRMLEELNRRSFLGLGLSTAIANRVHANWINPNTLHHDGKTTFNDASGHHPQKLLQNLATVPDQFPKQDPSLVQEMVTAAHGNLARVRELIAKQPALAKTSFDWGFGDWETPIDAASHVGNRDIAELLLKSGARPTIFSAAMLGQLSVVKAFIESSPGAQRILGPHSITLLSHAKAGGAPAQSVREYLESLGDADMALPIVPLTETERAAYLGSYGFGLAGQQLVVGASGESLFVERVGVAKRTIRYVGSNEFRPAGGESVRLRFAIQNGKAISLSVFSPELLVEATRSA